MKVELTPGAHEDILNAMEYYAEKEDLRLAADFYREFRSAAKRAEKHPQSHPIRVNNLRWVHFHRFPYHFLYRIVDAYTLRILTVRHDKQHPKFGLDRS